jgi:hypothetical protein
MQVDANGQNIYTNVLDTENVNSLILGGAGDALTQLWRMDCEQDSRFSFTCLGNGLALDHTSPGTLAPANGSGGQRWELFEHPSAVGGHSRVGPTTPTSAIPGFVISASQDARPGSVLTFEPEKMAVDTAAFGKVDDITYQRWFIEPVGYGPVRLATVLGAQRRLVLDIPWGHPDRDLQVQLFTYTQGAANQRWYLAPSETPSLFRIVNEKSYQVLQAGKESQQQADAVGAETLVVQEPFDSNAVNQLWGLADGRFAIPNPQGDGGRDTTRDAEENGTDYAMQGTVRFVLAGRSNLSMEVVGSATVDHTPIQVTVSGETLENQRWLWMPEAPFVPPMSSLYRQQIGTALAAAWAAEVTHVVGS